MSALGSMEDIPGIGVCGNDLRIFARYVASVIGVEADLPTEQIILEHTIQVAVCELDLIIETLDAANETEVTATLRRIKASLDCVYNTASIIAKLHAYLGPNELEPAT